MWCHISLLRHVIQGIYLYQPHLIDSLRTNRHVLLNSVVAAGDGAGARLDRTKQGIAHIATGLHHLRLWFLLAVRAPCIHLSSSLLPVSSSIHLIYIYFNICINQ